MHTARTKSRQHKETYGKNEGDPVSVLSFPALLNKGKRMTGFGDVLHRK